VVDGAILVFNILYNNMIYTLDIEVYIYIYKYVQQIFCRLYVFNKLPTCTIFFEIKLVG